MLALLPDAPTRMAPPRLTTSDHSRIIQLVSESRQQSVGQELELLEQRLGELVTMVMQLREENRALRQRLDGLTSERATLLQKNEQVRARVEAMIGRLKAMEHGA
jgi:cell division protein ZapB